MDGRREGGREVEREPKNGEGVGRRGESEWRSRSEGRDRQSFLGNTCCFSSWRIKCGPHGMRWKVKLPSTCAHRKNLEDWSVGTDSVKCAGYQNWMLTTSPCHISGFSKGTPF